MLAERTVNAWWLRLILFLLPFTPLLIILAPLTSRFIVLILCLIYLGPTTFFGLNLDFEAPLFWVVAVVYCAFLGVIVSAGYSSWYNLFGRISLRQTRAVLSRTWLPVLCILFVLELDHRGALLFAARCPAHAYILSGHCAALGRFRETSLGGFIDSRYALHFKSEAEVFSRIVRENNLIELDPVSVPDELWRQPPWWWNVRRGEDISVYKSEYFSLEGRGSDGDHFLFFRNTDTGRTYVLLYANF